MSAQTDAPFKSKTVNRLLQFPSVNYSYHVLEEVYGRVKNSTPTLHWVCDQAELTYSIIEITSRPIRFVFRRPITGVDNFCAGRLDFLDRIEARKRRFLENVFIVPLSKNPAVVNAFGTIDQGLNNGDTFVDKYLPLDAVATPKEPVINNEADKIMYTLYHLNIFARKIAHGIVICSINEIPVAPGHIIQLIMQFIYVTQLLTLNPTKAYHKLNEQLQMLGREKTLDEPRAENLADLVNVLTNAVARQLVEFVGTASNLPTKLLPGAINKFVSKTTNLVVKQAAKVIPTSLGGSSPSTDEPQIDIPQEIVQPPPPSIATDPVPTQPAVQPPSIPSDIIPPVIPSTGTHPKKVELPPLPTLPPHIHFSSSDNIPPIPTS